MKERIERAFQESIAAKALFLKEHAANLQSVVELIAARLLAGNKVLFFGNGGSAADAQHLAAEFVNRFMLERPPLPALALTTDTSVLTSIGNDYGYAEVFAKQVKALGREGDVAIALSTSGNSPNVLRAVETARRMGIATVGLLGKGGGELYDRVDVGIVVPLATSSDRIQEVHIKLLHIVIEAVERELFPQNYRRD